MIRIATLIVLLTGCAAGGNNQTLAPRVDETTGETIVTLREAVVLSRPVPYLSTAARDFLYLGPVEVDRTGAQEFYLWVGVGSTVDREFAADEALFTPAEITIYTDGTQQSFVLEAWHPDADVSPYAVEVPLQQSLRARVTIDELENIARAQALEAAVSNAAGESARYSFWRGKMPSWSVIAEETGVGFSVEVKSAPDKVTD
ncbi:MAG: hypothetical protein OES38_16095 [Gammaproteobacteria bacterium]|nr:hypothetical protein [Gammaproteobacteria bacterium]